MSVANYSKIERILFFLKDTPMKLSMARMDGGHKDTHLNEVMCTPTYILDSIGHAFVLTLVVAKNQQRKNSSFGRISHCLRDQVVL